MPELTEPTTRLYTAWLEARDDWGPGRHEDGFGLRADDTVETHEGFVAWVRRLRTESDPAIPLVPGRVPTSYWWIVEEGTILGAIALRHRLNDRLRVLGQIGYGIRPSARRRGLATWALGQVLSTASTTYGLDRVLIVCDAGNPASAGVIERQGGVLEDVCDSEYGRIRRYWVPVPV